jgi:DNA-binding transcriptional ArsR family regulator
MAKRLSDLQLTTVAETLRALAHETRLRLVDTIRTEGEKSVGELEISTGIRQPGLSQQLAILRKAKLVTTRRDAKQVYYSVAANAVIFTALFLGELARLRLRDASEPAGPQPQTRLGGSAAIFAKIV